MRLSIITEEYFELFSFTSTPNSTKNSPLKLNKLTDTPLYSAKIAKAEKR